MKEEEKKQLIAHATAILDILEGFKPATERVVKEEITLKELFVGTAFKGIALSAKDFNLLSVDVSKIFPESSGNRKDGSEWNKLSLTITDFQDERRELIAWDANIDKIARLRLGDRLDIHNVQKVTEFVKKDGTKVLQFTLGDNSTVEIVEEHVL